jgi:RND family efflux transporter MFP subunit
VEAAKAELGKARANLAQKRAEYDRQKTLYDKGWVAKARLDQVVRATEAARGDVSYARSKLGLAKRDLGNTVLVAPFDGLIAKKNIDPFVEVKAGQMLFEIDAKGGLEIAFDIPESTISRLTYGMPVIIRLQSAEGCPCDGLVTEIGEVASKANSFPLKATFQDPPAKARSGMTGTVEVQIQDQAGEGGYLVPFSAIAPGEETKVGYVFVFDPDASKVRRVKVTGRGAEQEYVAVQGIKLGDVVAIAGVNFLQDGQKVKLLKR